MPTREISAKPSVPSQRTPSTWSRTSISPRRRWMRASNSSAGRTLATVPDIDEARDIRRDLRATDAGFVCQTLRFAALQRHPEHVSLEGAVQPTDEVELAPRVVQRQGGFGRPLALG